MPKQLHGGPRPGAGRKPYPDMTPGGIVIDVRNLVAYVARWQRSGSGFALQPAQNWQALEGDAIAEIEALGGGINMSAIYPCGAVLAARAEF